MCSWVVTLPRNMKTDEQLFFEEVVKFLTKKYKKENVISAHVHKDETRPHLHFAFIPVTIDKKKGIEKVSAKEVLTRSELQHFHTDLDNHLTSVFGRSTGVLNEATKDGNQSIEDLKRGTAVNAVKEKQEELKAVENKITALKWADNLTPLKEKKDCVVLSKEDFESAKVALVKKYLLETRAKEAETKAILAENERKKTVNRNYEKELTDLKKTIYGLENEQYTVLSDNRELEKELDKIYKVFDDNPYLREQFIQLTNEMEQMQL